MSEKEYDKMSDSEKKKEDWMNSKWRPMMGWSYMATCITDFVIFPILWSIAQMIGGGEVKMQWQPITLMGAGLYHVAMGAVLGLAAWGRTQEKMAGANNGGIQPAGGMNMSMGGGMNTGGSFGSPVSFNSQNSSFGTMNQGFQQPPAGNFGATAGGFGGAAPVAVAGLGAAAAMAVPFVSNEVLVGAGGKPAPVQPPDPEI